MRKLMHRIWNDETGNVLVIMGAGLPLLVGAAGLATDTIQWTLWKRQLQRAADSAAIAGVYERIQGGGQEEVEGAVDRDLELNHHTGIALQPGYPTVALPADDGDQTLRVQVGLAVARPLSFSGMFLDDAPKITANAIAASVPGSDDYCVVSLEDTATTGITGSGSAAVEMDCGMITNSTGANSAIAKGNVQMKASVIASVGGIQESDNWEVDKYDPYVAKMKDPYADVTPDPNDMNCNEEKVVVQGGKNETTTNPPPLDETFDFSQSKTSGGETINCFSSLSVGSGETLNLPAGTYYISGGNAHIQGTLTGTDVTIVLTNYDTASNATIGTFDMNAGASMTLKAPTSGTFKSIAIYQDRRAVDKAKQSPNKINGNSAGYVTGSLYFPNQGVTYNGDGTNTAICTRFVSRRITFSGNNTTSNKFKKDCGGEGVDTFQGGRLIRLVA